MKKILYFLILSIVFYSCGSYSEFNSDYEIISLNDAIDEARGNESFSIDDLLDTVKIIKLQTSDESIMGVVWKVIFADNYIYVLSCSFRDVLIFDKDGAFVKKIGKGSGPGEITSANDICFDYASNELQIFQGKRVNRYAPNGDYIDCVDVPNYIIEVLTSQNGNVCLGTLPFMGLTGIFKIDSVFAPIDYWELSSFYTGDLQHYFSYSPDGGINFAKKFDDCIYYYNNDTLSLKYYLDYSKYSYDQSVFNEEFDYSSFQFDESKFFFEGTYLESGDFEIFHIFNGISKSYRIFRNKKTKKVRICSPLRYEGTQDNIGFLTMQGYQFTHDDYFFSYLCFDGMDSERKEKILKVQPSEKISKEDVDKIQSLTGDDNPLIVLYKLKGLE